MKLLTKTLACAGLALASTVAIAPAAAQVEGRIATADISLAIINTTALQNAYNQITTTYQVQIDTRRAKQEELSGLLQPFDSNGNGQLDESELPAVQASPNFTRIQTLEAEVAAITSQVNGARVYAVEQILAQYPTALTDVTTQQQIVAVFQPANVQFVAEGADITGLVTTALNTRVPSVAIVPPADWRPSRNAATIFQEIQQYLLAAQIQQQQEAAQQQPATQTPAGR